MVSPARDNLYPRRGLESARRHCPFHRLEPLRLLLSLDFDRLAVAKISRAFQNYGIASYEPGEDLLIGALDYAELYGAALDMIVLNQENGLGAIFVMDRALWN